MKASENMQVNDDKSFAMHDPKTGYTYRPESDLTLSAPAGRHYHLRVNSAGIRSDRDYAEKKPPGITYRIIALGDSFAAGQYVDNALRFSESLERRHPGLEVINLALDGTGTDQQLLAYEEAASRFEHDLVLILPFLQNIRRNLLEARESFAPGSGERILIPKPRFIINDGALELQNVPVPEERLPLAESASDLVEDSQASGRTALLSKLAEQLKIKKLAYSLIDWEPFPEYRDPESEGWQLMEAILRRLKSSAGPRPLAIAPIFYLSYLRYRMARNYLNRFESLAENDSGISVIDLLPHFQSLHGADRCFYEPYDCHFSPHGHLALADALESPLRALGAPC